MEGYRFVLCVLEGVAVGHDTVVRHRCHNRRCFNPDHLQFGTQADNKRDDWEFAANGVDFDLL
ncbi:HNH endonuclease [Thalassobius sp. I31.1]|uniref:HNH endonuclease n=1 Tax=Thalassobius sp. I31.1 TaxID=2109912 RepID=UPI001300462C